MPNEGSQWANLSGRLIVISGPSGSGKSTLVRRLLERADLRVIRSVSATTRRPRPGETPGRDYIFLTPPEFDRIRAELLEWAQVHDHEYGTPGAPVKQAMAEGRCVLLVIDVQGGFQVRERVPGALLIFIRPPSVAVLENRLRARGTDDEATIERRLAGARRELEVAPLYDVQAVNDDLEGTIDELARILKQNGCGDKEKP
jgi:guanylate kinase